MLELETGRLSGGAWQPEGCSGPGGVSGYMSSPRVLRGADVAAVEDCESGGGGDTYGTDEETGVTEGVCKVGLGCCRRSMISFLSSAISSAWCLRQ